MHNTKNSSVIKSFTRLVLLLLSISMTLTFTSCGGDDDEPSSSSKNVRAFTATYNLSGTRTEFYVSLNSKLQQGKVIIFYNNEYNADSFSYNPNDGSATQVFINSYRYNLIDYGSSITLFNSDETYNLSSVGVKDYWQLKYDEAARRCEDNYNSYLSHSVRFPELALMAAQNYQNNMKLYRQWAESDGAKLTTSSWETKKLV